MTVQSRWTLPLVVDPPERLCVLVEVPNERYHIAAFLGALYQLTRPYSWANDPAHTAIPVGAVWQPIFDSLRLQMCADFDCPIPIDEYEVEMSLCDNLRFLNGKLQALCCGQWVDVDGQASQGVGGPGQPGGGSSTPVPGGCVTYHAVLNGKDQWQAPPPVNAGDTVQISNLSGAWSDGAGLFYCPVGSVFFAGNCTVTTLDALDPLPSQGHMALLSKVAGVFTNVSGGGLITVPGGVVNALLLFQANDSTLSDNGGEITFDVTVCNNATITWTRKLDFRLSDWGFVNYGGLSAPQGIWTPGVGWVASDGQEPGPSTVWRRGISVHLTGLPGFNATQIQALFSYTIGVTDDSSDAAQVIFASGGTATDFLVNVPFSAAVNNPGTSPLVSSAFTATGETVIAAYLQTDRNGSSNAGFTGAAVLKQLLISGTGTVPTWGVAV